MRERAELAWEFPLPRIHTGISLGNGILGALIWGEEVISLTLARSGFWDHRGGTPFDERISFKGLRALLEAGQYDAVRSAFASSSAAGLGPGRPQQMSGGRLDLRLPDGLRPQSARCERTTGAVTITCVNAHGRSVELVIRVAIDRELCWIDVPDELRGQVAISLIAQWHAAGDALAKIGIMAPDCWSTPHNGGFHQRLPEDPGLALAWVDRGSAIVVATALGADPAPLARAAAVEADLPLVAQRTATWWSDYWAQVPRVNFPDPALNWMHEHGLFKQLGLTTPGGVAATLQGPWMEECRITPWSNDYHFNINLELIYWPALSSGRFQHLMPLWQMIRAWLPKLRQYGRSFLGHPDALMLPHATDDRGTAIGSYWQGTIDHASTAWMALLAWLHWRYDADREVLAEVAWPLLTGAFEGFWAMTDEVVAADGSISLTLPVSVSPEYGEGSDTSWGRNASFQLAAFHRVVSILPQAAVILGRPLDPRWERVQRELPPFSQSAVPPSPWDGPDAEKIFQINVWDGQALAMSHRHQSHLAGIYPFANVDWRDPRYARTIDHSLHVWAQLGSGAWCGWCLPWVAIICARTNRTEAAIAWLHWLADTCENEGRTLDCMGPRGTGSDWPGADWARRTGVHEIMQLDANLGVVTAIHELLVQCTQRGIELLPGLPVRWKGLSFDGIHAEGGFVFGADVVDRQVVEIRVLSRHGATLVLHHGMTGEWLVDGISKSGPVLEIPTTAGQRLILGRARRRAPEALSRLNPQLSQCPLSPGTP